MSSFVDTNYTRDPSCLTRHNTWFSEHRDLHATAMSVDWSGQYILLAGRSVHTLAHMCRMCNVFM